MRYLVEIPAVHSTDPDGVHTAAALAAYLRLEEVRAFWREIWCRLAAVGVAWTVMAIILPVFRTNLGTGLTLVGLVAIVAAWCEWRAASRLHRALRATECFPLHSGSHSGHTR